MGYYILNNNIMIEKIQGIPQGEGTLFTGDQSKINELIDHANKQEEALEAILELVISNQEGNLKYFDIVNKKMIQLSNYI